LGTLNLKHSNIKQWKPKYAQGVVARLFKRTKQNYFWQVSDSLLWAQAYYSLVTNSGRWHFFFSLLLST
jgi:hypothetical protein